MESLHDHEIVRLDHEPTRGNRCSEPESVHGTLILIPILIPNGGSWGAHLQAMDVSWDHVP